jgi:hypothetical protein
MMGETKSISNRRLVESTVLDCGQGRKTPDDIGRGAMAADGRRRSTILFSWLAYLGAEASTTSRDTEPLEPRLDMSLRTPPFDLCREKNQDGVAHVGFVAWSHEIFSQLLPLITVALSSTYSGFECCPFSKFPGLSKLISNARIQK